MDEEQKNQLAAEAAREIAVKMFGEDFDEQILDAPLSEITPIIKAAIEKAEWLSHKEGYSDGLADVKKFRAAQASEQANVHIEHYFPKGYDPDKEPFKTIVANYRKSQRPTPADKCTCEHEPTHPKEVWPDCPVHGGEQWL